MKRQLLIILSMCSLTLVAVVLTNIRETLIKVEAQNTDKANNDPLPKGKWTVAVVPDSRQFRNELVPVVVTRTTMSTEKGEDDALEQVILWNRSEKDVASVKLRYSINAKEDANTMLYQSPQFDVFPKNAKKPNPLTKNRRWTFKVPNGRIARLIKPLVKEGELAGDYFVNVIVSEVVFEDGTIWK